MDDDVRPAVTEHLASGVFLALRETFFDAQGEPVPFLLRDKRNTQDDPLDEHIAQVLTRSLTNATCLRAPGPLITPDMVIARVDACQRIERSELRQRPDCVFGLEVKKLERTGSGAVARSAGLDYNTTPPCGTVRVYDSGHSPLDIPGFYLFVCLEDAPSGDGQVILSAAVFCDGDLLNADFGLYLSIVGQREKEIGLGTYGDGVDRKRPMLIFSNPLGASQFDHAASLIVPSTARIESERLAPAYEILRTAKDSPEEQASFVAYRSRADLPADHQVQQLVDPFPVPAERKTATQARGRFSLPFTPAPA